MPFGPAPLCRVPAFAECQALDKEVLCLVPAFAECQVPNTSPLPSARHLAKDFAVGKAADSGSAH